jgi:hypothetical protein
MSEKRKATHGIGVQAVLITPEAKLKFVILDPLLVNSVISAWQKKREEIVSNLLREDKDSSCPKNA